MIKNKQELGGTDMRNDVIDILEASLKSVDPTELMSQVKYREDFNSVEIHKKTYYLFKGRIFVVGGGKAAGPMAEGLEAIIGADNIFAGIVNAPYSAYQTKKIKINKAGHPLPDKRGVKGVEAMLGLKEKYQISEKDLVLCLISGGGSAMLPAPVEGVSIKDKQDITEILLKSGATIQEINCVRKHLSRTKGGQLAKHFAPAQVVTIIVSDISDCDISVIASGPTSPDPMTFKDAWLVVEKHNLVSSAPESVINYLRAGAKGEKEDTPKILTNADNYIIGTPARALEAMSLQAKDLGYKPIIVESDLRGDPEETAQKVAERVKSKEFSRYSALIFGGETTPTLPKRHGQGGRNMHYVAASLPALKDLNKKWTMASLATDGRDYLPGVAGAIIDSQASSAALAKGLAVEDYLKRYDSYNYFKKLENSIITTAATGTNVCDVIVYLLK